MQAREEPIRELWMEKVVILDISLLAVTTDPRCSVGDRYGLAGAVVLQTVDGI